MGKVLSSFYDEIKIEGGIQAQMRLAMATALSQQQCLCVPDSKDNIDRFNRAYKVIVGKKSNIF